MADPRAIATACTSPAASRSSSPSARCPSCCSRPRASTRGLAAWGWVAAVHAARRSADAAAAPDPRGIRVERRMPRRVLLGQRVDAELRLRNTGTRARCADACATRGSRPRVPPASDPRSTSRPASAGRSTIPLLPRRRGELTLASSSSSARTVRCGSPGARSRIDSRRRGPGAAALHRAPAPAVAPRAAARARRQHQRAGARAGHRVRQPARVRPRRRRALDRLAGDRARRRRRCCAPGAPSATGTS